MRTTFSIGRWYSPNVVVKYSAWALFNCLDFDCELSIWIKLNVSRFGRDKTWGQQYSPCSEKNVQSSEVVIDKNIQTVLGMPCILLGTAFSSNTNAVIATESAIRKATACVFALVQNSSNRFKHSSINQRWKWSYIKAKINSNKDVAVR